MYTMYPQKDLLNLRAYGRNVQNLVRRIQAEGDEAKRTAYAYALVPIMRSVNPQLKTEEASAEKVWQDIFAIASYELEVEGPYKPAVKPSLKDEPVVLGYGKQPSSRQRRYGRNIPALLAAVEAKKDKAYVEAALLHIAKWLLTFHRQYNSVDTILRFFQDVMEKEHLPDLAALKQRLERVSTHGKNTHPKQKRFFKRRRKC